MTQEFINNLADKLQKVGALHAIGETWISIDSTIPAGGVPFLGQLINRSVWADLFAWATSQGKVKTESEWQSYASANGGNCPFYSDGDGSTTFRMPCIKSYLKGADTLLGAGSYTAEGLPNITGSWGHISNRASWANGAVQLGHNAGGYNGSNNYGTYGNWDLNASRSSSIYGNSDHVTPETHSILVGVYAVGVVANIGSADATQFLNGLATLEANTNAHIRVVETWRNDTSWYRVWSDGWCEQGQSYLSPNMNDMTVSLFKPFVDVNYFLGGVGFIITNYGAQYIKNKTTSSFYVYSDGNYSGTCGWFACGYIAI